MPSRRSSGRQCAAGQPEFLIDRSLGRLVLPAALREVGLAVQTLADVYGEVRSQEIEDVASINLAAARDLVVLCKDDRIRRRPAERQALADGNVRVFCLTKRHLSFADQAAYFVGNRYRIIQKSNKPGPYLYGVYKDKIEKLWPLESQATGR